MKKIEVQQRVLQNGRPLDLDKFNWCETTKTFSTTQSDLVLDFTGINFYTFITGGGCTFNTGGGCNFITGGGCNFITGIYCVCIRTDIFEFFEIPVDTEIRLNSFRVKGFEVLEEIS